MVSYGCACGDCLRCLRSQLSATEAKLADSDAKKNQFMTCADALEDLAEERDPVRCLSAKGLELTYECPADAPCLACRVRRRIERTEAKLAGAERELADVRTLDALACRHGTRLDIPAKIPGFDPGDGSDHLHFVLMPIGARSRRAAVEYLATKLGLIDKEGG